MNRDWLDRLRKLVGESAVPAPVGYVVDPSLDERRRQFRLDTRIDATLRVDGDNLPVSVVDLHHGGARVLASRWVRPGSSARLLDEALRLGRSRLDCEVSWAHTQSDQPVLLGLRFEEPVVNTWILEALKRLGYSHPSAFTVRKTRRVAARVPFELQDASCFPLGWGATLDLGLGGALLKLPFELRPKEVVRLVLITSEIGKPLTLLAQVVGTRKIGSQNYLQNLRFYNLLPLQREKLEDVLIQHLRLVEQPLWLPGDPPPPRRRGRRLAYPEWLSLPD